jgi:tRNA pseudouridine32 synthase / 23S rRNA pseudouridine746 synthase
MLDPVAPALTPEPSVIGREGLARDCRRASYWVMTPEETRARLLYRDGLMLVLDKPAGIAVHKGPKGGASLEDDFEALRFGLPRNPALAHRLDRETAGCLVLGRHHKALEKLGLLFKQGRIGKTYWAIVEGGPQERQGLIDLPLGRLDPTRGWWMKVDARGLPSQTRWTVAGRGAIGGRAIAWLELEPLTGRTHQLRVHCAAEGWPILGDAVYGTAQRSDGAAAGLQLLARRVCVPLSSTKPAIVVEAPAPAHMLDALALCGFPGDPAAASSEGDAAAAP